MSIKIHHGPPGSYKTSGAVMDDFIPAAKAGRIVVTNVRGLSSRERVEQALGELPESFELHYLPTIEHQHAVDNREALARWFHWLPHGALLLLDEAQSIWPQAWKEKELATLDYPGGLPAATEANRPKDWLTAFEMHRHYGWDMVLTTPNITKIRKDVIACAEGAYKHKNLAVVGIRGRYIEAFHLADDSGKSASDFLTVRSRKITKQTWALYESTATGTFSDTKAGLSLFKDPKVLGLLGVLALSIGWVVTSKRPAALGGDSNPTNPQPPKPSTPVAPSSVPVPVAAPPAPAVADLQGPGPEPLKGFSIRIAGHFSDGRGPVILFEVSDKETVTHYRQYELVAMGYGIANLDNCSVKLTFGKIGRFVSCARARPAKKNTAPLLTANKEGEPAP